VVVPSVKGEIKVEIEKTFAEYRLGLTSPDHTKAIVGIPKGSFTSLKSIKANGITIWDGKFIGGMKGISWNGEDAGYIKFNAIPGKWTFVGIGSLPITSPKQLPQPLQNDRKLDKKSWTATASVKDSTYLFNDETIQIDAASAIDGDHWTGWRDKTRKQYPGQWFMIDMKEKQKFDKITLDNTWALWDSPNKYSVFVSQNDKTWGNPVATGSGELGITTINLPLQHARYLKIVQTGADTTYNWSIYEIDVFRKR